MTTYLIDFTYLTGIIQTEENLNALNTESNSNDVKCMLQRAEENIFCNSVPPLGKFLDLPLIFRFDPYDLNYAQFDRSEFVLKKQKI